MELRGSASAESRLSAGLDEAASAEKCSPSILFKAIILLGPARDFLYFSTRRMMMTHEFPQPFARNYESLLKRLKLRGMRPKTIESYSHGVRRAGAHFDYRIDDLSKDQLTDYFAQILDQLSWSTLKHDLYGRKFYSPYV